MPPPAKHKRSREVAEQEEPKRLARAGAEATSQGRAVTASRAMEESSISSCRGASMRLPPWRWHGGLSSLPAITCRCSSASTALPARSAIAQQVSWQLASPPASAGTGARPGPARTWQRSRATRSAGAASPFAEAVARGAGRLQDARPRSAQDSRDVIDPLVDGSNGQQQRQVQTGARRRTLTRRVPAWDGAADTGRPEVAADAASAPHDGHRERRTKARFRIGLAPPTETGKVVARRAPRPRRDRRRRGDPLYRERTTWALDNHARTSRPARAARRRRDAPATCAGAAARR